MLAWHERTTRHQTDTPVFRPDGSHYEVPFVSKGLWRTKDNFIRRPDGTLLEFCPVGRVQAEMGRFTALYHEIRERDLPVEAEAAWAHHRFVRTHPFDDGNGRVGRLLMAHAYFRRGLPPPTIRDRDKEDYYFMLDRAVEGDLRRFSRYIGALALPTYGGGCRAWGASPTGRSLTNQRQWGPHGRRAVLPAEGEGPWARARLIGRPPRPGRVKFKHEWRPRKVEPPYRNAGRRGSVGQLSLCGDGR